MNTVSHDFASTLRNLNLIERRAYRRGARDMLILALIMIAFTCLYLYVGGGTSS